MSNSSDIVIRKDAGDEWLISIMNEPGSENGNSQHNRPIIPMLETDRYHVFCWYLVGIGPYSKGHPRELNGLKTAMVRQFVKDSGVSIEVLYNKVAEVVMAINARKYYDEAKLPSDLSDEEFVNILFLDGCFVLHYIFSELRKPENLKMFTTADAVGIKRDMLLLQSQLPYQILQSLMSFRFKEGEGEELINDFIDNIRALPPQQASFMKPMKKYLISNHIWLPRAKSELGKQEIREEQPAHLLEILQRKMISKKHVKIDPRGRSRIWYRNHSAKDLRKKGIHFRPSRTDIVTDVKFKSTAFGGILELPRITIDISSKPLLFNLIRYENDYDASKQHLVSSYLHFLDSLIQDAEDVNILQAAGILINNLGSDQQVAGIFNQMNPSMRCSPYAYNDVKCQIELHYGQITKRWIAECLQAYFSNPWTFIAFSAATLALTLTAIQTYLAAFNFLQRNDASVSDAAIGVSSK